MPESFICQEKKTLSFSGKLYAIKHNISDEGTVESSEVCYILNNTLHCLKGGDGGASYSENISIVQSSFGQSNCSDQNDGFYCRDYDSGLDANTYENGFASTGLGSWGCYIQIDGETRCTRD